MLNFIFFQNPAEIIYGQHCECTNFACPRHNTLICGGKLIGTVLFCENYVTILLNSVIITITNIINMNIILYNYTIQSKK